MAFEDNPIVQALGSQLGMDFMLQGAGNGAASAAQPTPVKPPPMRAPVPKVEGSETPREFRQHAPIARPAAAPRGAANGMPVGMNLPGVMSPDVLMHPVVQSLLNQYGVDPTAAAQHADPNLFIPQDSQFSQQHHRLASMLEGALEGGAFTHGSSTPGEGISNVLQGMLASKQARADKYNNQLMMPFAQAEQVANLKSIGLEQQFKQAQAKHYQDLEDHYTAMDDNRQAMTDLRSRQAQDEAQQKKLALVQKYQHDAGNIGFTPEERAQWEAAWQKGEDDPSKVDPEELGNILAAAKDRQIKAAETGKNHRADVMAGAHVTGAKINASTKPINPEANKVKQDAYRQANTRLQNFSKALANTVGSFEGDRYIAGTPKAIAKAKELQDAADRAKADWEQNQVLQTPGMLNVSPANSFPTYDPKTGQINRK